MINRRAGFALVVMLFLSMGILLWYAWSALENYIETTGLTIAEEQLLYHVKPGANLTGVAADLADKGVIAHSLPLVFYARVNNLTSIKTGEYQFQHGVPLLSLLQQLNDGDVTEYRVTLLEGWNISQVMAELGRQEKLKHQLAGLDDKQIIKSLGLDITHLEGQFFPDTYYYHVGTTDTAILLRAYQRMQRIFNELWPQRAADLPYKSPYEALIMASIVEKESGLVAERARIAGVFVERLRRKMRLQTDPTVIYGLGKSYNGNLTRKHLKMPTPYNTYTNSGLPPTPIAMPSAGAIAAALNPEVEGYIYFVAKGDGSHQFSKTLAMHNKAVKKYQIQQRASNYRSSPGPRSTPDPASAADNVSTKRD